MAFFSVIIPTYNRGAFINKAIESVLSQTYQDWELIVINDASTDDTKERLAQYTQEKIRVYHNESNLERSASRNKGISLAKGQYLCFLDSDDYFLPNHLSVLAKEIEASDYKQALFHTGVEQHDLNKGLRRTIVRSAFRNAVEEVIACHIPVITVAIDKRILNAYTFDTTLHINEDVYLFAQIAARYPIVYIPEVSVVWILHGNNTADQEKDYYTPQLLATQKIVNNKDISPSLSATFKNNKFAELYAQLVFFHAVRGESGKAFLYFLKSFWLQPFNKGNRTNFLNVVYHLPGGKGLKQFIKMTKSLVSNR